MTRTRIFAGLAALATVRLLAPAAARAEQWRNHFDADAPSRAPAFFDFVVIGTPARANWIVVQDRNPPSAPNQLTQAVGQRPADSLALAIRRGVTIQDGKISVSLKKQPGRAGVVLRKTSDKDFVTLLFDGASGEAVLTSWRDGKPTELARGKGTADNLWGRLDLTLAGPDISATWNETALLHGKGPKPAAGAIGLATQGPGRTSFDEFVIDDGK
jgi:hypothetical protein